MKLKHYLIFDFGASNGRAIVANFNGKRFWTKVIHRFDNTPVSVLDSLYWDVLNLYYELKTGIRAARQFQEISSIAIDTWGVDFGFIDKNGNLISNPLHYRDNKDINISNILFKIIPKRELFNLNGGIRLPTVGLFNLYYLKLKKATEYTNAYRFLMMPDLFNYFLTGNSLNEYTELTTSMMCNQTKKKLEPKLLEKLDIPLDIFPEMIFPGSIVGRLQKPVCRELEIKSINVIAPATHDTASAVAGIPVKNYKSCWAFISFGTWCVLGIENQRPVISDKVFNFNFINQGGVEGTNILVKNSIGLWILQQCFKKWKRDSGNGLTWDRINRLFLKSESFISFFDIDDPVFINPNNDMPKTIIEVCRVKNKKVPKDMTEIVRCFYENLVMKFKYNLIKLEEILDTKIEFIHIFGGGIQNEIVCQWIADATHATILAGPVETTSIGNLLMQLKADGEINDLEEGRRISLNSSKIINYNPENTALWDNKFNGFLKTIKE